jgi:hypothetical protein
MNTCEKFLVVLALALLLSVGTSSAHRMLIGYQIKEVQLNTIYDDGTCSIKCWISHNGK